MIDLYTKSDKVLIALIITVAALFVLTCIFIATVSYQRTTASHDAMISLYSLDHSNHIENKGD